MKNKSFLALILLVVPSVGLAGDTWLPGMNCASSSASYYIQDHRFLTLSSGSLDAYCPIYRDDGPPLAPVTSYVRVYDGSANKEARCRVLTQYGFGTARMAGPYESSGVSFISTKDLTLTSPSTYISEAVSVIHCKLEAASQVVSYYSQY